jgi:hypothetical protein
LEINEVRGIQMQQQIPMLRTKETALLRGDYPSIEYLEAGNTAS